VSVSGADDAEEWEDWNEPKMKTHKSYR